MPRKCGTLNDEEETGTGNSEAPSEPVNPAISPSSSSGRRDDSSLSFRHFLRASSDNASRQRVLPSASHEHQALPDFVQDHLVVESSSGSTSEQYAPQPSQVAFPSPNFVANDTLSSQQLNEQSSRPENASSFTNAPKALPDFLSDGPMNLNGSGQSTVTSNSHSRHNGVRIGDGDFSVGTNNVRPSTSRGSRNEREDKQRRINTLEQENARLLSQIEMLESEGRVREQELAAVQRKVEELESSVCSLKRRLARTPRQNGESSAPKAPYSSSEASTDQVGELQQIISSVFSSEDIIRQLTLYLSTIKSSAESLVREKSEDRRDS